MILRNIGVIRWFRVTCCTDFKKPNTVQKETKKKEKKRKRKEKGKRHLKLVRTVAIETATGYATLVIQVGPRDSIAREQRGSVFKEKRREKRERS